MIVQNKINVRGEITNKTDNRISQICIVIQGGFLSKLNNGACMIIPYQSINQSINQSVNQSINVFQGKIQTA